ncbi:MAG: hypothetical protein ACTHM6_09540 [Tepidisphaeraceae bacterium]
MACHDPHCPFLNRNDSRCADHFQVTHLQHAFRFCFDRYKACPTYLELLVERRVRHAEATHAAANTFHPPETVPLTIAGKAHAG